METIQEKVKKLIELYGSKKGAAKILCVTPRFLDYLISGQRNIHTGLERLMDLAIEHPELFGEGE